MSTPQENTPAKSTAKPSAKRPSKRKPPQAASAFQSPSEPDWHHMIAEAAYFRAEKRGFVGDQSLEDWLAAEEEIREVLSAAEPTSSPVKPAL